MGRNFKKFLKSEFAIALSTTSITTAVQMLAGLVINKILAITIGPSGIALMGQFSNFKELTTNIANGSFGQGITKYIADPEVESRKVISTSSMFTLIVSIFVGIIVSFSSKELSSLLLQNKAYAFIFIIFGISLPLFAINNLLISVVNGYRDFKTLAKLKIANSSVALVLSGMLAWYFHLKGALLASAVNTSIVLIISLFIIFKQRKFFIFFNYSLADRAILKKLLAFSLMALTSVLLKPVVQLIIRNYIITYAGEFDAGIWEATKKLSDYYNQIITVALGAYYLPKLSSLTTASLLKKEIIYGIKIVMPIFITMASTIFLLKDLVIQLLFSNQFILMSKLIFPQLIGDFFMIFSFMIAYLMLAKAMVKTFMISQLCFAALRIFLSISFFNLNGIEGVIWANATNYFLYTCFVLILFRKTLFQK